MQSGIAVFDPSTPTCTVTPSGRIAVHPDAWQDSAGGARIAAAFDGGRGAGVLHLGAAELSTSLPASLSYWRDIGRAFVAQACAGLDPAQPAIVVAPELDDDELARFVQAVPPMPGAELVSAEWLRGLWSDLTGALAAHAAHYDTGVQGFLEQHHSIWNVVGRVCFHLAENKGDKEYPFAFIATYVHEVSRQAKAQHVPLGRALEQYAGANNRQKLLALLAPLSRAAEQSELIAELVQTGDIYEALPWQPAEAHRFLCEIAAYERAGLVVRTPDWWNAKARPRPKVSVSVGGKAPSTVGVEALLAFEVDVTLGGKRLTRRDIEALLATTDGLAFIKGRWVEVDRDKLSRVLAQWEQVQAQANDGVSFGEAMRMLAGLDLASDDASAPDGDDARPEWSEVIAGKWLARKLEGIRSPTVRAAIEANAGLRAELRPYQKRGVQWLVTLRDLGLGGCLADDMGLGKTVQVLGALAMGRRNQDPGTDLLVVPASLIENWRLEIERFAPGIAVLIAHPSRMPSAALKQLPAQEVGACDAVITTYGTAMRTRWMHAYEWRNVILDEAQAIKNPGAKQTKAIKSLRARWRLALTGTPVENRLGDLWSIFDFINPGLLGTPTAFNRACKAMAAGDQGYAPLRRLVQPYILRRLKTDKSVIADLPDKTEVNARCLLSKRQAALYQQAVNDMKAAVADREGIARKGVVLSFLLRFKQICNHPSQWLGDGSYEPEHSGKFARLRELCESIASRQDKVLVFTQFREMTAPLADFLARVFERDGLVLHGGTRVARRQNMVQQFQTDDQVPFMVLSLKAGGTGLNLTAASHVIHFDRWWNPAVENQATDRAFRIGQKNNVLVHKFVCAGTVEERIDDMIAAKQQVSDEILSGGAETSLTELTNDELISLVTLDVNSAMER